MLGQVEATKLELWGPSVLAVAPHHHMLLQASGRLRYLLTSSRQKLLFHFCHCCLPQPQSVCSPLAPLRPPWLLTVPEACGMERQGHKALLPEHHRAPSLPCQALDSPLGFSLITPLRTAVLPLRPCTFAVCDCVTAVGPLPGYVVSSLLVRSPNPLSSVPKWMLRSVSVCSDL